MTEKLYNDTTTYLNLLVNKRLYENACNYINTCDYQWFNPAIYDIDEIRSLLHIGITKDLLPRIIGWFIVEAHGIRNTNYLTLDGQLFTFKKFGDIDKQLELFKKELKKFTVNSNNRPPISYNEFKKLKIKNLFICKNCSDYLKQIKLEYSCTGDYCIGGIIVDDPSRILPTNIAKDIINSRKTYKTTYYGICNNINNFIDSLNDGAGYFIKFDEICNNNSISLLHNYIYSCSDSTTDKFGIPHYQMSNIYSNPFNRDENNKHLNLDIKYDADEIAMMFYMSELKEKASIKLNENTKQINDDTEVKLTILDEQEKEFKQYKDATITYLENERIEISKQREKLLRQMQIVNKNTEKFQMEFKRNRKIKSITEIYNELQNIVIEADIYIPATLGKKLDKIGKKLEEIENTDEDTDTDTETVIALVENRKPIVYATKTDIE
uniref:Uncharacterized protein n=1 Tax=viral metagenome TaxID=1070528 RepID=A0A6C0BDI9_9ZZZZ